MTQEEMEKKLTVLRDLAKELTEAPVPVVKYRAEMVVSLFEELMVTAVSGPNRA